MLPGNRNGNRKYQRSDKNKQTNNFMSHNDESFVIFDVPPGAPISLGTRCLQLQKIKQFNLIGAGAGGDCGEGRALWNCNWNWSISSAHSAAPAVAGQ